MMRYGLIGETLKHSHSSLPVGQQQLAQLLLADQGLSQKKAFALANADDEEKPVPTLLRQPVTNR